jgi:thiamine-phosphate pyrophosphorylase
VVRQVRDAAASGVQLIQVREHQLDGRALLELARRVVDAVHGTSARVLINDRLDVALASSAHGVHLRSASYPAARARALVPTGFLIGTSVHSASEASAAADSGADYVLFGNVFESASKPGLKGAGLEALAAVVRRVRVPVLAVGGITPDRIPQIQETGAAGFAAISMFRGGTIR